LFAHHGKADVVNANQAKITVNERPFDKKTLAKARRLVDEYRFAFWREDGRNVSQCVEMDTLGTGDTAERCRAQARALAVTGVAYMVESGKRPPPPAN
jgi:hypothetical protein